MNEGALGRIYNDGELVICQGDVGDCMYVVQEGKLEVFVENNGEEIHLAYLTVGDLFGEMAVLENEVRSASVRAVGDVRLLTLDKNNFLTRIHQDPSLAYRLMQRLSSQIRLLVKEISHLKALEKHEKSKDLPDNPILPEKHGS
jgi:CRP/FNR family transcriptional regulator, cyclic AMP receptor protein